MTQYHLKVFRYIFAIGVIIALYALSQGATFTIHFQALLNN